VIQDDGVYVVGRGLIEASPEWEDQKLAIEADMEAENFYPNVWRVSDHGNITSVNLND
jgi:hypothetical protein